MSYIQVLTIRAKRKSKKLSDIIKISIDQVPIFIGSTIDLKVAMAESAAR